MEKDNSLTTCSVDAMFRWTIHPVKKDWRVSTAVILFLVVLCSAIYFSFDSLTFAFLSLLILFCSLNSFFFPTTYILQDDSIIVMPFLRKSSKAWKSFKSYYIGKNGVLLSPFVNPSKFQKRLESFRGLYIRFGNNKKEVLELIKKKIAENSHK